ncbi:hypothetical protein [Peribacillus sp. NPDC097295]|uniref:hypothetical protein n=1 Tax=Peribacillus sp. NPDC097295 TaxID=3364402 RepID=UPI0037FBDBD8
MEILTFNEFIIKKPVTDLQDLVNNPVQYIVNIEKDFNEFISIINNNRDRYIEDGILTLEGGLFIQQHYREISGVKYFDDLPTLWSYILNVVEEYLEIGNGKSYFPSQPIKIQLNQLQKRKVEFLIDHNRLEVEQDVFLKVILDRAEFFFITLVKELSLSKYKYEIDQIQKLKSMI